MLAAPLLPTLSPEVAVIGAAGTMAVTFPSDTSDAPADLGPALTVLSMGIGGPAAEGGSGFFKSVDPPPFLSFEEAAAHRQILRANNPRLDPHILQVEVTYEGEVIGQWWEVSGPGGLSGHTEQLALGRMNLRPGMSIEFRGGWSACNRRGGCFNTMDFAASEYGVTIDYRTPNWNAHFEAGEGHIPEYWAP
jgi:hypothetical protein